MIREQTQDTPQGGNGRQGLPYLKAADASTTPTPARVMMARVQPDQFKKDMDVVALRLQYNRRDWLYNLRQTNPCFKVLLKAWGKDEEKWAGKELLIYTEEDDFTAQMFLRLDPNVEPEEPIQEAVARAAAPRRTGK
jgi:hypothetical protein